MPTYTYKALGKGCTECAQPFSATHLMQEDLNACGACGGAVRRVISRVQVRIRHTQKANFEDYRPELARFPGDPEAKVTSDYQLNKLIEKRQRQGWRKSDRTLGDLWNTTKNTMKDAVSPDQDRKLMDDALKKAQNDLGGLK